MAKPAFTAYAVTDYGEGENHKTKWREIGAAWPHKDGKGYDVTLEALPVSGRVVLRAVEEKPAQADERAA
jgi:hypothetical protein